MGGSLHQDWIAATLHVAAFRVQRVHHICLVTRKDPVFKLIQVCHLYWDRVSGPSLRNNKLLSSKTSGLWFK